MNKTFLLSKTALNGLNFIKREEEQSLVKKEQPEQVLDVFRFLLILSNEKYKNLKGNSLKEEFYDKIFSKYKLDNLSKIYI